ncbi:MAG: NAD-dependent epimerase/dehydratase family protein [Candidatus Micrarchaeia archaeon]|jgi:UDP-glucose 4-epimerase
MKYLITGGAGYIGSHLADALLAEQGNEVVVLDDLSTGTLDNLKQHAGSRNFKFIKGDACDHATAKSAAAGCNVILHEAAIVGVKHYVTNPLGVLHTNTKGTENMLEAARRNDAKLIFASTSEVYGRSTALPLSEEGERVLGATSIDRWCYSTSKAFDEHLCFGYGKKYGTRFSILRYFNSYGPRALNNDYAGVAGIFMRRILANQPPLVHGDGKQTRCFTYISDTVAGTLAAIGSKKADGEIINIGSDTETSIIDLASLLLRISGRKLTPKFIPYSEFYGKSYEDIRRRVPAIAKAKALLGWSPKVKLEKGLKLTYDWYAGKK